MSTILKKTRKPTRKDVDAALAEVKDDPEFKEFLSLQRNIGENNKVKQIWSDDVRFDADVSEEANSNIIQNNDIIQNSDIIQRKRHKRSRGKKKSTKTKPKELFVHTIKVKGFPETIKRKDVKDFFKPSAILSVRLNKKDGVCYVSFENESDLRFSLRKNLQFLGTSRIRISRHHVKRSRVFKEILTAKIKKYQDSLADTEPLEESGRLFIRNLNYTCTQDDLEQVFSKYGELTDVHYPIDKKTSLPKGYAYVEYMFPQNATQAYQELNGTMFQGRKFHLIPSKPKPEQQQQQGPGSLSSFKREQILKQKQNAPKATNWNILFLGQNALADVVSEAKGIDKSELLTAQTRKDPIAVRMALGDATVVEEVRKFLVTNGIELDSFDNPQAPRSRTVILAKNLPASTDKSEVGHLFEAHGRVARVIMPPNGLTAIVEMEEPVEAKLAFKRLAYSKFKDSVLYLEWAPINVFREKSLDEQEQAEVKQLHELQTGTKMLVKNIPFEATAQELKKLFATQGELKFVRLPKKMDGQHRGFGFVDFLTKEDAMRAFRGLGHSTHLYGRKLVLEWAKPDQT